MHWFIRSLFFSLSLCFSITICQAQVRDSENWAVNSAWVKELTKEEQRIILILLRGEFNEHIRQKVMPKADGDKETFFWMLKQQAHASFMLSQLATQNKDLQTFFVQYADNLKAIINSRSLANYLSDGKRATTELTSLVSDINPRIANQVAIRYQSKLKDSGTALIAFSALRTGG